jgi:hypothetical protein
VAAVLLLGAGLWLLRRRAVLPALAPIAAASLLINVDMYAHVLPGLQELWISPRIAAVVARVKPCRDSVLATSPYREPSLVFLLGSQTRLLNPTAAADTLAGDRRCGLALIGGPEQGEFLARLRARGVTAQPLAEIAGRNYSYGKTLTLTLFRAAAPR